MLNLGNSFCGLAFLPVERGFPNVQFSMRPIYQWKGPTSCRVLPVKDRRHGSCLGEAWIPALDLSVGFAGGS